LFAGHLSDVDVVKFHPNGSLFATGSSDKSCRIWDLASGNCVRLLQGLSRSATAIAFSKQGRLMSVGDLVGRLYVYDIAEGKFLWSSEKPNSRTSVLSIDFSNDGKQMAVSYSDCKVSFYSCDDFNQKLGEYYTKQTPIYTAKYNTRDILMCAGPFSPE
jgi:transcription initiation factor TFIID subunit 5